ncbi:MAG: ATPase subunit of ABC transporter with duplicated ATPase domains [Candidatus Azotimanducaceae bacterium]|jgi:ATPase subunit of ABC transporter with duplicated ATPase domains
MTTLIQGHRISHALGTKQLFENLDITVNSKDRIGLVGHNGSGKSTLLSILNRQHLPDEGDLSFNTALKLETVEQFIDNSLLNLTLLEALGQKLPPEERAYSEYKLPKLLQELGFAEGEYGYKVDNLSGGQQNRLMFARALINEPNLILFDEPTNHLDLATLVQFENLLCNLKLGFLLISHDRHFLDAVTNRTIFLRDQRSYSFSLPYTAAKEKLDQRDDAAAARLKEEEKSIKSLKASAKRLAEWGKVYDNEKLARKAKTMEKRIDKLEESKTFVSKGSSLNLTLDVTLSHANRMLQIENKPINSPGPHPNALFFVEDFFIRPGDRIALLGHNGVGKTTLIKLITSTFETNPESDSIKFNPQCDLGYYDQELEILDQQWNLVEALRHCCNRTEGEYKTALIKAGFPYLDMDKQVKMLSGGEKARLMFLIIKLNQPNFLILDEPTNHIDIQGKEQLEKQLLEHNATLLITSHDRRFVDNIADRFVLIENGVLTEINDPTDFYRQRSGSKLNIENENNSDQLNETINNVDSEDKILQRIIELEKLLEDDLARKPKFQKLLSQENWNIEIDELSSQL